jgi:hypothetical protein
MSLSQLNQSTVIVSLISTLFIAEFNTSSTDSISSTSILSALKRHLELRYRLDFSDFLDLLIMRCMKNVIDFQQTLKSRSYKKTINDSSRDEWLKIMKNENKSFLINEIWTLINLSKDRRVFRDKWVYKIKRDEHDVSALQNAMSDSWLRADREIELYEDFRLDNQINEL